jgi:hypothetical protein
VKRCPSYFHVLDDGGRKGAGRSREETRGKPRTGLREPELERRRMEEIERKRKREYGDRGV